jgi:hypothetical protein
VNKFLQIALPPSTSRLMPVINPPSALARYNAAFATSSGSVNRPSGTLDTKFARFSGVSGTPTNDSKSLVPQSRGAIALTRMLKGPNSAARPLVAYIWRVSMSCCWTEYTYICYCPFACIIPY